MPYLAGIAAAVWLLVFYSSRFVSLASILAAMSLPVAAAFLEPSSPTLWVTGIVAAFVVIRHRSNIGRLLAGTENRFDRRKVKEDEK
jgi:glycerol-3-phosphate acyltransferase PlsY